MPTRITLICHGSTSATRSAAFPLDEPLETQARTTARRPAGLHRIDQCWTSPALCARQTAAAMSFEPVTDPDLSDCDYGRWAGRRLRDVEVQEPDNVAAWLSDVNAVPHGGESIANVLQRIAVWLDRRVGESGHGVAITHSALIRGAILHAIGATPQSFWHIDVGPLTMTELRSDGARWRWRAVRADDLRSK